MGKLTLNLYVYVSLKFKAVQFTDFMPPNSYELPVSADHSCPSKLF